MANHYVFLNPGERLFVMTTMEAGRTDYAEVIEVEFPTVTDATTKEVFHAAPKSGKLDAHRITSLELNEQANLTCDGDNLIHAYARERDGDNAYITVPSHEGVSGGEVA